MKNVRFILPVSAKVAVSFMMLVLIQGLLASGFFIFILQNSQRQSMEKQILRDQQGVESYLAETLRSLQLKAELLAGQQQVIEYTQWGLKNLLEEELGVLARTVSADSVMVFRRESRSTFSSRPAPLPPRLYEEQVNHLYQEIPEPPQLHRDNGVYMISLFTPIERMGEIIGVLVLRQALDARFLRDIESFTGTTLLLHIHTNYLYSETIDLALPETSTPFIKVRAPQWNALPGYISAGFPLTRLNSPSAMLICLIDLEQFNRANRQALFISLLSLFLSLAVALVIALIFYRRSFFRPFQSILKGVHSISQGNLHYRFDAQRRDEFGELGKAFNVMSQNLEKREKEIRELSRYNEMILNSLSSGIITLDDDDRMITINPAARRILSHGDQLPLTDSFLAAVDERLSAREEMQSFEIVLSRGGFNKVLSVNLSPLVREEEPQGRIIVFLDVTEIRKLEQRLFLSERLAALGEMVAGIAHQIKNPLGIMKVSAEMLRDDYQVTAGEENYHKITAVMVDEIDRLNYVIDNFLDFARLREPRMKECSLASLIQGVYRSLSPSSAIRFEMDVPEELLCYGDPPLLIQVFSNLLKNAFEVSQPGDCVTLTARREGLQLVIDLSDQGPGIPEEVAGQIFNPFFSTKARGNGLGLSIAHRIVEQHEGALEYIPSEKGAHFRIIFGGSP